MRSRLGLSLVIAGVLLASCGRPTLTLEVNGVALDGREASYCSSGGCSATCADGPANPPSFRAVAAGQPIDVVLRSSLRISEAHVQIETLTDGGPPTFIGPSFDVDADAKLKIPPLPAGRHQVLVLARFETPFVRGNTSYAFGLEAR
jgi:hypothetical protein